MKNRFFSAWAPCYLLGWCLMIISCTAGRREFTTFVPPSTSAAVIKNMAQPGVKVSHAPKVTATVAMQAMSQETTGGTSSKPDAAPPLPDLATAKAQVFKPMAAVKEIGLLSDQTMFLYKTQTRVVDVERFEMAAPTAIVASRTISPERLLSAGVLTQSSAGGYSTKSGELMELLPAFPWPPPKASASLTLDNQSCGFGAPGCATLGEVDKAFNNALTKCGYVERSYFSVPGGYALVTRLEQIEEDGTPMKEPLRWQMALPGRYDFWNVTFWRDLLKGTKGRYRVVAFMVTSHTFRQRPEGVDAAEVMRWLGEGGQKLPPELRSQAFGPEHTVTALIYEFERREIEAKVDGPLDPSRLGARQHLEKSGILATLNLIP